MARRSDAEIKKDVVEQLMWDSRVDASEVTAVVNNGIVTLGGEVSSYFQRSAAIEAAWMIPDVKDVVNQMTVQLPATPALPADADVQERIATMLEWNSSIDHSDIHPSVLDGLVTLEGTVDAHWKRAYVQDIVANMHGVVAIYNNLAVVPTRSATDQVIAEDVVAALKRDLLVNPDDIEVEVERGVVSLAGRARSQAERKAAEHDASFTQGVVAVRNQIDVEQAAA